jgi:hypothetical protein
VRVGLPPGGADLDGPTPQHGAGEQVDLIGPLRYTSWPGGLSRQPGRRHDDADRIERYGLDAHGRTAEADLTDEVTGGPSSGLVAELLRSRYSQIRATGDIGVTSDARQ